MPRPTWLRFPDLRQIVEHQEPTLTLGENSAAGLVASANPGCGDQRDARIDKRDGRHSRPLGTTIGRALWPACRRNADRVLAVVVRTERLVRKFLEARPEVRSFRPYRYLPNRGHMGATRLGVLGALALLAGGCGGGSDNTGTGNSTGTGGQIVTGTGGTGAIGTGSGGDSATGGVVGTGGAGATGAPGPFSLQSPLQGSSAQLLTPQLSWEAADGATTYAVEIATSTVFGTSDVFQQIVDAPATTLTVPTATLAPGVIYYWRVSAQNGADYTIATGAPQWFSSPYVVPGAHGIGATPDGRRLVVASEVNSGPIALIDLASHTVATIDTGINSEPIGIAIAPDGQEAVATLLTTGTNGVNGVAVVDLVNNVVEGTIDDPCVGTTLSDVAYFPDGAAAMPDLSPGCAAMGLTTFDPVLNNPQFAFANFSDTNDPYGVAVSPDGTFALVTMELDKQLYRVDFPSQAVSHIALSSSSAGVAITPDGTKAVVAETTLDVVDVATGAVTPVALTGDTPGGDFHNVAITPDGKVAVVAGATSIQFVSLTDNSILAAYPATTGTSVAMSPDGSLAYVTDKGNGWVRVLAIP